MTRDFGVAFIELFLEVRPVGVITFLPIASKELLFPPAKAALPLCSS